jgi:hypothetical protein
LEEVGGRRYTVVTTQAIADARMQRRVRPFEKAIMKLLFLLGLKDVWRELLLLVMMREE